MSLEGVEFELQLVSLGDFDPTQASTDMLEVLAAAPSPAVSLPRSRSMEGVADAALRPLRC